MTADQLGTIYLIYDCQHFSESLLTKSLNLIFKYSAKDMQRFLRILKCLFSTLEKFESKQAEEMDSQQANIV